MYAYINIQIQDLESDEIDMQNAKSISDSNSHPRTKFKTIFNFDRVLTFGFLFDVGIYLKATSRLLQTMKLEFKFRFIVKSEIIFQMCTSNTNKTKFIIPFNFKIKIQIESYIFETE